MLTLFTLLSVYCQSLNPREEGQGLVEYALILVLVSIVVIVALLAVGTEINAVFENIGETLRNPPQP